eukprot:gene21684-28707_t
MSGTNDLKAAKADERYATVIPPGGCPGEMKDSIRNSIASIEPSTPLPSVSKAVLVGFGGALESAYLLFKAARFKPVLSIRVLLLVLLVLSVLKAVPGSTLLSTVHGIFFYAPGIVSGYASSAPLLFECFSW